MNDLLSKISKRKEIVDKDGNPKHPVNIFSKPVNVLQTEEGKKSRMKGVIVEGLLFGAFLTAITAIYSFSGLELKLDPTAETNTPSLLFFLVEFVLFSALVGVGDYFLTEKRVNEYNQKVAGVAFNIDEEIEKALEEQKKEGMTEEEIAALNKTNGEEAPKPTLEDINIEIKDDDMPKDSADKVFSAYDGEKKLGSMKCCKVTLLDSMELEHGILQISSLTTEDEKTEKAVSKLLFAHAKELAVEDNLLAVIAKKTINDKHAFGMFESNKFSIECEKSIRISEAYPGALMGMSGKIV